MMYHVLTKGREASVNSHVTQFHSFRKRPIATMPHRSILQKINQYPGGSFLLGASAEIFTAVIAALVFLLVFSYIFTKGLATRTSPVDVDTCTCSCWDGLFKGGSSVLVLVELCVIPVFLGRFRIDCRAQSGHWREVLQDDILQL